MSRNSSCELGVRANLLKGHQRTRRVRRNGGNKRRGANMNEGVCSYKRDPQIPKRETTNKYNK